MERAALPPIEQCEPRTLLTVSFVAPVNNITGDGPSSIVLADVNGDQGLDIISVNSGSNTISVLLGNGSGAFGVHTEYGAGALPVDAVVADFNGDGFPDIAIADEGSGNVTILFNNTNGTFAGGKTSFVGGFPVAVTAGDFNGDGLTDVAVVIQTPDSVRLLLNTGGGNMRVGPAISVGAAPYDVVSTDLNNDGFTDLAVSNSTSDTISLLMGNGDGTFLPAVNVPVGPMPTALVTGDFNGDGRADLAVTDTGGGGGGPFGGGTVTVLLNSGAGNFAPGVDYTVGFNPISMDTGDIDGDGTVDLVVGDFGTLLGGGVTVLTNNGDGTFGLGGIVDVFRTSEGLAVGDLDLDGRTDMVLPDPATPTTPSYADVYMSDRPAPVVTVNQSASQVDPTVDSPINFTVVFSSPVTGFTADDVLLSGSAGATIAEVTDETGDGTTYNVAVSGMLRSGLVIVRIPPNVARDAANNGNLPSISVDNKVTFQNLRPSVTINQASSQSDPTNHSTISFTVAFSRPVTGFDGNGIVLTGTAGATTAVVTGGGAAYNVTVSGMTQPGTIIASIPSGVATALDGYINTPSTSTDNVVTFDNTPLTVTVDTAPAQLDPTDGSVIRFTVVFNKLLTGFSANSVLLSGTAGATTATVTGSGSTYDVAVTGMTRPGTVIAAIPAGAVVDAAGNENVASTSTDNVVFMRSYTPRTDYIVGMAPLGATAADFNGDGKSDLVFVNSASNTISVLMNQGNGSFAPHADYLTGFGPAAVAAADFNGDGRADLAVVAADGDVVSVYLNRGDGTFFGKVDYVVGSHPTAVVAADFSHDGHADLAVINRDGDSVSVLVNHGNGTFAPAVDTFVASTPTAVAAADFDGDGLIDLAVATRGTLLGSSGFSVLLNAGGSTFLDSADYTVDSYPEAIVAADLNGDHMADVALVDNGSNTLNVMLNNGTGVLVAQPGYVTASNPVSVATLDFNGDGRLDLAVACSESNSVGVFLNTGGGAFGVQSEYAVGRSPRSLATGDFNGDGRWDIAVSDNLANQATVLLNNRALPTAAITPGAAQANPTHVSPINFQVVFTAPVTGFTRADVVLSGSAGATTAVVTGGPTTYNVAVSGMQRNGAVTISIPANAVVDAENFGNAAATGPASTINYDNQAPSVTINRVANEPNPTNAATLNFTVVFSEPVSGFSAADVVLSGTAGATTVVVTSSRVLTYNVAVSGMTQPGTVIANILAGAATDAAGNASLASTSTDNAFQFDNAAPTVTINKLASIPDPTNLTTLNFTVLFSRPVFGFNSSGVTLSGTAGATTAVVTGSGGVYNVAVSGMSRAGTVVATIPVGVAADIAGNGNLASTSSDNIVNFDNQSPAATIVAAVANASPINFTVTFNKPVTGFVNSSVVLSGTAGATTAVVTGSGAIYNLAVSGMQRNGTVIATIPAGAIVDAVGNSSVVSTGTANYDTVAPGVVVRLASGQAASTSASTINFAVVFSEPVVGFSDAAVLLGGTGAASTMTITGSGATYNIAVTGMQQSGTVTVAVPAGRVTDPAGNLNTASNTTGNSVTFDNTAPMAALHAAAISAGSSKPYKFTVTYTDDAALNAASIGNGDLIVTGPKGQSSKLPVTWVKPAKPFTNASSITASYTVAAPGGTWDKADNGLYTVTLQYRQVSDLAGNSIAGVKSGLVLGTFRVGIAARAAAKTAALFSTTPVVAGQRPANTPFAVVTRKPNDVLA